MNVSMCRRLACSSRTAPALLAMGLICVMSVAGCTSQAQRAMRPNPYLTPDTRQAIPLSSSAGKEHRAVMLQHLETMQVIVDALVEEDYELAKGLTESHLGFFRHRQALAYGDSENFPPSYHDLALAHHEAAEALATTIPSKDLKKILPAFNNLLKACVACHLEYKVTGQS